LIEELFLPTRSGKVSLNSWREHRQVAPVPKNSHINADGLRQEIAYCRALLGPLESGRMRIGQRTVEAMWLDCTQTQVAHLKRIIEMLQSIADNTVREGSWAKAYKDISKAPTRGRDKSAHTDQSYAPKDQRLP
jgi:hypothetical protein